MCDGKVHDNNTKNTNHAYDLNKTTHHFSQIDICRFLLTYVSASQ
jgi:hypothetical protein